jgi:type IV pilus assembly protein PilA
MNGGIIKHYLRKTGGFTLVELLVVLIMVGALSAIALPSYLNNASRSRTSEAKANLGAALRSQQSFRIENGTFAADISQLEVKLGGDLYTYRVENTVTDTYVAMTSSTQRDDLKVISSGLIFNSNDTYTRVVCESDTTQLTATRALAPSATEVQNGECPAGYDPS